MQNFFRDFYCVLMGGNIKCRTTLTVASVTSTSIAYVIAITSVNATSASVIAIASVTATSETTVSANLLEGCYCL